MAHKGGRRTRRRLPPKGRGRKRVSKPKPVKVVFLCKWGRNSSIYASMFREFLAESHPRLARRITVHGAGRLSTKFAEQARKELRGADLVVSPYTFLQPAGFRRKDRRFSEKTLRKLLGQQAQVIDLCRGSAGFDTQRSFQAILKRVRGVKK